MLPISLDCRPCLNAPSVFSNVYLDSDCILYDRGYNFDNLIKFKCNAKCVDYVLRCTCQYRFHNKLRICTFCAVFVVWAEMHIL
jgi:hypothetical protein